MQKFPCHCFVVCKARFGDGKPGRNEFTLVARSYCSNNNGSLDSLFSLMALDHQVFGKTIAVTLWVIFLILRMRNGKC